MMKRTQKTPTWSMLLNILGLSFILLIALPTQAYHYPWDQGHDTTDYNDPDDPGSCDGGECKCDECNENSTSSPIYTATGDFIWTDVDISLNGKPNIGLGRTFNSNDPREGLFGKGWSFTHDRSLIKVKGSITRSGKSIIITFDKYIMRLANGKRYVFIKQEDGSIKAPEGIFQTVEPQSNGTNKLVSLEGNYELFGENGSLLKAVDRNGNVVNYTYGGTHKLLEKIADENGRFIQFSYNSNGRVSIITDHHSRTWSYDYDALGNLVSITDPLNGVYSYEYKNYQPTGDEQVYTQITKIIDQTNVVVTQVTYNGRKASSYTEGENKYAYAYNTANKYTTKTDSLGSQWQLSYDDAGLVTEILDPLNNKTQFIRNSDGLLTKLIDSLGNEDTFTYDALGRQTSSTTPIGATTKIEYVDGKNWPKKLTSPTGRTVELTNNTVGNVVDVKDPAGFSQQMEWDAQGNNTVNIDALGNRTEYSYDSAGRTVSVKNALGDVTNIVRDDRGNVVKATDPKGNIVTSEYDLLDRVVKTTDALNNETVYVYDAASRPTKVTNATGQSIVYQYDVYGRLSKRIDYNGRETAYTYRADNLAAEITLPSGKRYTATYADNGLKTSETIGSLNTSYVYNADDQLVQASNETGTVSFTYDDAGRVVSETNNGQTLTYEITQENELSKLITSTFTQNYSYDNRGSVTQMTGPYGNFNFEYDELSRRTKLNYPNSTQATYRYDALSRLTSQLYTGSFNANYDYTYDVLGNITTWNGDKGSKTYRYDVRNQLIEYDENSTITNYTYDKLGNRIENGENYNSTNALTQDSEFTYSYDVDGNLTEKKSLTTSERVSYLWDDRNQLVQVQYFDAGGTLTKITSYTYGPLGQRWTRTENGVIEKYVYSGADRIATLDSGDNVTQSFYHGPSVDEPLGLNNGSDHFYHANYLGSVMALTDSSNVVASYEYSPYGVTTTTGPESLNPYRFTGREYDENDLYYYRSRYYNPKVGRFISPDPLGIYDDINYYRYVRSNPTNYIDPTGEAIWIPAAIAYGRCIGECAAFNAAISLLTGCGGLGVGSCAMECLNPMNWLPIKWAKRLDKLKKLSKLKKGAKKGLGGNPFKGKTPQQIDDAFRKKGFDVKGTDPVAGKGSYINPKTGRKYYIDKGGKYKKGTELPHVDVHRPSNSSLPKKKFPLGDKLIE